SVLIVAAGLAKAWSVWRRDPLPSEAVRFCLRMGALSAILTAVTGWMHAATGNSLSSPQLLAAHCLLGTTAVVWLVITTACAESDARSGRRRPVVRLWSSSRGPR